MNFYDQLNSLAFYSLQFKAFFSSISFSVLLIIVMSLSFPQKTALMMHTDCRMSHNFLQFNQDKTDDYKLNSQKWSLLN